MAARIPTVATQLGLPLLAPVLGLLRLRLLRLRAGVRVARGTRWHGQGGHLARAFCARLVEITAAGVSCCHLGGAPMRAQELPPLLAPLSRSDRPSRAPQLRRVLA